MEAFVPLLMLLLLFGMLVRWLVGPRLAGELGTRAVLGGLSGVGKAVGLGLGGLVSGLAGGGLFSLLRSRPSAVLCPGDPPPPADRYQDYLDYRGVAQPRELGGLRAGTVSLGRYAAPNGRRGGRLSLPADLLQRNCAVIGPPGSGKTEGIIIPWALELLQAGFSVVTVDIKGDLVDRIGGAAQQAGHRVWYWNSADPTRSGSWNWLDGVRDSRDTEAAVQSILGRPKPNDPQPFFYERDYRWLRTLIGIVKGVHGTAAKPRDLYALVAEQELLRDQFRQHPQIRPQVHEVTDLLQFSPDEHSRAVSGLLNALHLFNTPEVIRVSERSDFLLAGIGKQPTLLIVGASLADARSAEVLSSIMLNQLLTFVYRRFSPGGSQTPLPLYFIIDEAARLKDRLNYEEALSIARSAKVGICLAAQDVSQFGDERVASAILTNCLTFLALPGCSPQTAKHFSARLGQRVQQNLAVSRQRGPFDLFSQQGSNIQSASVPVLGEREIMHPPVGRFCAVAQVSPVCPKPFLVDLARGG